MRVLTLPMSSSSHDNPFGELFMRYVGQECELITFTWRRALFDHYDAVHFHWPEALFTGGFVINLRNVMLLCVLAMMNKWRGVPHIETIHNLRPHQPRTSTARLGLAIWQRTVYVRIFMAATPRVDVDMWPNVFLPHGDYRPIIHPYDVSDAKSSERVLLFGHLRRYKDIERLMNAWADSDVTLPKLLVVGRAETDSYLHALESISARTADRVQLRSESLPTTELLRLIKTSSAVVLPYPNFYNSGAAILALSLDVPVVLSRSSASEGLAAEVGQAWVQLLPTAWDASALRKCLEELEARAHERDHAPLSDARNWVRLAEAHARVYAKATVLKKGKRSWWSSR
ncbi:hypothetical protein QDR37_03485 [Amnibacterium sp. CER49]|uniref:hypothetical protein n=1 Tax=Amnibacterium sp. CER49 TaxID=3039161 RepID=UPI00244C0B7B|nr:hypothetical protein [Amnibacterium sp. CER49]MDH2443002.1 hypothetical protein [Amnibacterium sp. CER49]